MQSSRGQFSRELLSAGQFSSGAIVQTLVIIVEKGIGGKICHSIYQYAKADDKYMKDYDKNKEPSYIQHWDVNNLYGWATPQKLPVNNFEWTKNNSQFNEDF